MILQSDNGREFVAAVIVELRFLWPELVLVNGRPRHPQSQGKSRDQTKTCLIWYSTGVMTITPLNGV